eukprot:scaffold56409_cov66-Phaeocystis_antarctica.AAC.5
MGGDGGLRSLTPAHLRGPCGCRRGGRASSQCAARAARASVSSASSAGAAGWPVRWRCPRASARAAVARKRAPAGRALRSAPARGGPVAASSLRWPRCAPPSLAPPAHRRRQSTGGSERRTPRPSARTCAARSSHAPPQCGRVGSCAAQRRPRRRRGVSSRACSAGCAAAASSRATVRGVPRGRAGVAAAWVHASCAGPSGRASHPRAAATATRPRVAARRPRLPRRPLPRGARAARRRACRPSPRSRTAIGRATAGRRRRRSTLALQR